MYNDETRNNIINDLENKVHNIVKTAMALASQGYIVNKSKYVKLSWSSILIDAFQNIDIFNNEQKANIELIYNRISTL